MKNKTPPTELQYPAVLSEEKTLELVLQGYSIGRYGDGELNIMRGGDCVSQKYDEQLADELRTIAIGSGRSRNGQFVIGVPRLDPRSPKLANWTKLVPRFSSFLCCPPMKHVNSSAVYGSAFITRPDSAPWIDTKHYFDKFQSLWQGLEVVLVANGQRSFTKEFLEARGALKVNWVPCSYRDSYAQIDALFESVMLNRARRVLLCCGPSATCLADRVAAAGKHAVDIGHLAMFWRNYERKS